MIKRIALFGILWLAAAHGAAGQEASAAFAEAMLAMETLSGEFKQRILDNEGAELQVTAGEFKVKRPGYFLWRIAPPYEQIVVGTPAALKVYDPDLEQLSVHRQDSLAGTPAALISGDVAAISRDYDVDQRGDGEHETFVLRPKAAAGGAFGSLTFVFRKKKSGGLWLSAMHFVDKLGQTTEIVISKLAVNQNIADRHFQFEAPEGTDIIVDG